MPEELPAHSSQHSDRQTPDSALPVVFILGPTATGKTAVATALHQRINCTLISVDSSQVYRRLDIGSAKPGPEELRQCPHALIDIREPWETYSAADFCTDAKALITETHALGKVPVLVGGTMLYFKALEEGLSELPRANQEVRDALNREASAVGWEAMHNKLATIDPESAARIHANDPQRIQRALEVWQLSGRSLSQWHARQNDSALPNPILKFALQPVDRALLHQVINERFQVMLQNGLVAEVKALASEAMIHRELPSMRSVGYRQAWSFLLGEINESQLLETGQAATRQLAKRQLTWLRSMDNTHDLDCQSMSASGMSDIIATSIAAAGALPGLQDKPAKP